MIRQVQAKDAKVMTFFRKENTGGPRVKDECRRETLISQIRRSLSCLEGGERCRVRVPESCIADRYEEYTFI